MESNLQCGNGVDLRHILIFLVEKKEPKCYNFILSCHHVKLYLLVIRYDYFYDNWNNQ